MSLLQKSQSVEISRRSQPFYAKKNTYSLGQQVQIEIDTQREFIDPENTRLHFKLGLVAGNTATAVTGNPWVASSLIKNLRIKTLSGQMIGHEQREYRGRYRFEKKMGMSNADARTSSEAILEGANAEGSPNGPALTTTAKEYCHKLDTHIFGVKDYYPAHFHQGLMIEFDLSDNAFEIANNWATALPVFEITDVYMLVDLVQLKPEIENQMVRLMEEQKLFVDYVEHLEQSNSLAAADSYGSFDVVGIDGRVKSAFNFIVAARDSDTGATNDTDYWGDDDAASSAMARNGLTSYRYRLGSRYLNYSVIDTSATAQAEPLFELKKALDSEKDKQMGDVQMTEALRDTAFYGIGVKVDKAMNDVDEVISSQVDKDRNNLRVELVGTVPGDGAGAGACQIYTFVKLDRRIQLLPGSIIRSVRS